MNVVETDLWRKLNNKHEKQKGGNISEGESIIKIKSVTFNDLLSLTLIHKRNPTQGILH